VSLSSPSGRTWEQAATPAAARLARKFEADWRASQRGDRPDPRAFLPEAAGEISGVLLALLRAELSLRRDAGESIALEDYRGRYPELGHEALVGLIYEEFCLREEAGERPDPREYQERFSDLSERLRRVFEIHGLVGTAPSTAFHLPTSASTPLPEVGQTIAGFYLVEELGRGAFARVFRAEERQLADRPVALKVARAGSREPQTLARLQHTHIVPVHSYRTDPATELHLLCMPYLGGVTLSRLLSDVKGQQARSGAELLAVLDRLEPALPVPAGHSAGRRALEQRTYVRAIAWWGARLAEALHHAHERGILHRDVKPSNVLVTGDGLPMLLDFNLAWETRIDDPDLEPAALGGTLAYMSPEHLEGLADGMAKDVDARADIYSLGVVLYEAMGARPFGLPKGASSVTDALLSSARERRAGAPKLRDRYPEVPPEFAAVVERCLAPEPGDRYASAADLAVDLQAVADDAALRYANEPIVSRTVRGFRRNRLRIAVAAALFIAPMIVASAWYNSKVRRDQLAGQLHSLIAEGNNQVKAENLEQAQTMFGAAEKLGSGSRDPVITDLTATARAQERLTKQRRNVRADADDFFTRAPSLRLRLLDFIGPAGDPSDDVEAALEPFYVMVSPDPDWTKSAELDLLDEGRRTRLVNEVNDLMFLWAIALDRLNTPELRKKAVEICERGVAFAKPSGPWEALHERCRARLEGSKVRPVTTPSDFSKAQSPRACFQWSALTGLEGRSRESIAWLDRATRLDPSDYWYHYYLAFRLHRERGDLDQALHHYEQAVTAGKDLFWARFGRAIVYEALGAWERALEDLQVASKAAQGSDIALTRLQFGVVHQSLGDEKAAREDYDAVVALAARNSEYRWAARFNLASLDFERGDLDGADARYKTLLQENPKDEGSRKGRALIALRSGRPRDADAQLSELAATSQKDADIFGLRAEARLALGQVADARADAETALRLDPTPMRERLLTRIVLAKGDIDELRLNRPDELDLLPVGGPALVANLRAVAARLKDRVKGPNVQTADLMNLAVILTALGDTREASATATKAVAHEPASIRARMLLARFEDRAGHTAAALDQVKAAVAIEPDDPRSLELRGLITLRSGSAEAGLVDLDRALARGGTSSIHASRALALMKVGRPDDAINAWSLALKADPDDPRAYLGRARVFLSRRVWTQALADLEKAVSTSGDRRAILAEIAREYARCLPSQPNRRERVIRLAERAGIDPKTVLTASKPQG
jgi:serine/threonine protein kinase/Tfp pilus assembly protein PilF